MREARGQPAMIRALGTGDAVVVGLGAMVGAGIFAALGPAAGIAGSGLLLALGIAGAVAFCNAISSAELASLYPESGGTYVYGRQRLGERAGFLAGWAFVCGKTASCVAMALTFGAYLAPEAARPLAAGAVVALTALDVSGIERTARATRLIIAFVLAALAVTAVAMLGGGEVEAGRLQPLAASPYETLQAAGLLFFAFAGYARIATLGEEVRDPSTTIWRAIPIALGIALAAYATVAVAALAAGGPAELAGSAAPLAAVVERGTLSELAIVTSAGAVLASLGVLLSMIAGVGRTTLAMARRGDLPRPLARVHPRWRTPFVAELAIGAIVCAVALAVELRGAIGFSSALVLTYYAIANASALTLAPAERRAPRWVPALGLVGCATLALTLPPATLAVGVAVLAAGALGREAVRRRPGPQRSPAPPEGSG